MSYKVVYTKQAIKSLKKIINKTVFAVAKNESRPVLTGVLFSKKDNNIDVVATDSHRLSKYRVDLDNYRNGELP